MATEPNGDEVMPRVLLGVAEVNEIERGIEIAIREFTGPHFAALCSTEATLRAAVFNGSSEDAGVAGAEKLFDFLNAPPPQLAAVIPQGFPPLILVIGTAFEPRHMVRLAAIGAHPFVELGTEDGPAKVRSVREVIDCFRKSIQPLEIT